MAPKPADEDLPLAEPVTQTEARVEPKTVGTGSSIAVGCVVALLLLLLLAAALRAFTPVW